MKTAVIIARFQTPYLHEGHKQLINQVTENHAKLIILLGDSFATYFIKRINIGNDCLSVWIFLR